jgi:hypothetical protein
MYIRSFEYQIERYILRLAYMLKAFLHVLCKGPCIEVTLFPFV